MAKGKPKESPMGERPYLAHLLRKNPNGGLEHIEAIVPAELLDLCEIKRREPEDVVGTVANRVHRWFHGYAFGTETIP